MTDYKQKLLEASYWDSSADKDLIEEYEVLFCAESDPDYEMNLYGALRKDGELFELEEGHCSCNGYDFRPGKVTLEYLRQRAANDSPSGIPDAEWAEFRRIVDALDLSSAPAATRP